MTDNAFGFAGPPQTDELNRITFLINQVLGTKRTIIPAKIIAVHGGGTAGAPTLDIQPMINQVDAFGNSTPHGVVYGIACARGFGGANGIICDPVVGDTGLISVADRDISSLKANSGAQSNPGSGRRFDLSDATYHGAMYPMGAATNYINLNGQNMVLVSPNEVTINAPGLKVNGYIKATGNITAGSGGGDQVDMQNHVHPGITPGGSNTDKPLAGS